MINNKNIKKLSPKLSLLILIVLTVVAVAIIYLQIKKPIFELTTNQPSGEKISRAEKLRQERLAKIVPRTKIIFQDIGVFNAYAEGRVSFPDNQIVLVVEAALPDPTAGQFYATWLVHEEPFEYIKLGEMTKNSDGLYELSYSAENKYSALQKVIISLEDVHNNKPEKQILVGVY